MGGELTTPSPPIKSLDFEGFDSSRLLILRVGNSHDSRTLNRTTLNRWTGRIVISGHKRVVL